MKHKFKVGEVVEQIKDKPLNGGTPLCIITKIERDIIYHRHLDDARVNTDRVDCFKKIPKLKRLLLYGGWV